MTTVTKTENFGIQRKIVSNMTSESWETIPHVTYIYEADVTDFMDEYKKLNFNRMKEEKITFNTLMMKVICEGLKAAPAMNAHIEFKRRLVRGKINTIKEVNISMPMMLPNGEMMTINLQNFGEKNLDQMTAYLTDVSKRIENTNLNEVMYSVSIDNTLTALKRGKLMQTVFRLVGSKTGKHKVKVLKGRERKEYKAIPETDRLTKRDIEQGTVTISNIGSLYRNQKGSMGLLEIIPPQVCAFGVGAVQEKPSVVTDTHGHKEVAVRQILPICIAFDHRALDFGEIVPFMQRLDEIFEEPKVIRSWTNKMVRQLVDDEEAS